MSTWAHIPHLVFAPHVRVDILSVMIFCVLIAFPVIKGGHARPKTHSSSEKNEEKLTDNQSLIWVNTTAAIKIILVEMLITIWWNGAQSR